jgi:hypothetical protein
MLDTKVLRSDQQSLVSSPCRAVLHRYVFGLSGELMNHAVFVAVGFGLSILLGACGNTTTGSTPQPTPSPSPQTLYRGDWGWAAVNVSNANDYIGGVASFSAEITNDQSSSSQFGKKIAAGVYNVTGVSAKPVGVAAMGAIATPLDAAFGVGKEVLLVAVDSNGLIENGQSGKPTFSGVGRVYFSDGTYTSVAVAFVQSSNSPTYTTSAAPVNPFNSVFDLSRFSHLESLQSSFLGNSSASDRSEELAASGTVTRGQGPISEHFR